MQFAAADCAAPPQVGVPRSLFSSRPARKRLQFTSGQLCVNITLVQI